MTTFANTATAQFDRQSYTDLNSLNEINRLGRSDKNAALDQIASQFESMLVKMMMSSMRKANAVFSEGNPMNSKDVEFYQSMFDDQLALTLSNGKGMGFAEALQRQLQQQYGTQPSSSDSLKPLPQHRVAATESSAPAALQAVPEKVSFDSPEAFIDSLYESAMEAGRELNVPGELLLSQAALETGWGKKMIVRGDGQPSNNVFNIKADQRWTGDSETVSTLEVRGGIPVREQAAFRVYQTMQQSFQDYVDFIRDNPRYQSALAAEQPEQYIRSISDAGYATDPDYADKVLAIFNSDRLANALATVASPGLPSNVLR